jgi:integrase
VACVRKRRGKWVLDYRDQHGARHWETIDGTRKDAELLLAERLQEIGRGDFRAPDEQKTFDELVAAYRTGHIAVAIRDTTAEWYEAAIRNHLLPFFAGRKLREITVEQIERLRHSLVERGKGRRTINMCLTLLGSMFRYALRHRWVNYNPASLVTKLKEEQGAKQDMLDNNVLTPAEINALLKSCDDRYRPLLMTAVLTGLRQGELFGLEWGDVDWNAKQIHVRRSYTGGHFYEPKTKYSRRKVDFPDALVLELKKWKLRCPKGEHDLVFPTNEGTPEHPSNMLRRGFFPALRRAGLRKIRFHDLRHTYASLLIANKEEPKRIQSLLGHSSIKITFDVYGHLMPNAADGVADRLGNFVFSDEAVASGSKMVATAKVGVTENAQPLEEFGSPGRTRTADPVINSHLLYRLSYRGRKYRW